MYYRQSIFSIIMKRVFYILLILLFINATLSYAAVKEVDAVTYYPSPDGDFKVLKVDEIHGGDDTYKDAFGNLRNADTTDEGVEIEERVDGLNADYLDGYDSSQLLHDPVSEVILPGVIIGMGLNDVLSSYTAQCLKGQWLKGLLVFNTPLRLNLCMIIGFIPLLDWAEGLCIGFNLDEVYIGIEGFMLCASMNTFNPFNFMCEGDSALETVYLDCKQAYENNLICYCKFIDDWGFFDICGWDSPCSDSCPFCDNCIDGGLVKYWGIDWCCNNNVKDHCDDNCNGDLSLACECRDKCNSSQTTFCNNYSFCGSNESFCRSVNQWGGYNICNCPACNCNQDEYCCEHECGSCPKPSCLPDCDDCDCCCDGSCSSCPCD